jgi:glycosyltransferase involved in cell wall biosynthesis
MDLTIPTISAVIITRNRPDLLRPTLRSIQGSTQKLEEIVVSDDSTDDETAKMLAEEFPDVVYVQGPRRGRSANRNNALRANRSDYAMMCDDDILLHPEFPGGALARALSTGDALFFPYMEEQGGGYMPNGLDFLGFSTVAYEPGMRQHTANSQCFIVSRRITDDVLFDETVSVYGYEEFDFAYRVAAAEFPIIPMPEYACQHVAPVTEEIYRVGPDASRLFFTFKRHFYVDGSAAKGLKFAMLAVPHHFVASFKRAGFRGVRIAWSNLMLAWEMLRSYRRMLKPN